MQPSFNFQGRNANLKPTTHNEDLQAKSKELYKSQRQKKVMDKKYHDESLESLRTTTLYAMIKTVRSNRRTICVEYL